MTSLNIHTETALAPWRTSFIPDTDQKLCDAITRLAGDINAAEYRFIKLLAALIERKAWTGRGIKSPAHWLNYHCGLGFNAARQRIRVARSLESLPLIDAAFSTGEISYSKVRAMVRSATPANESLLLNVAKYGTAQHVEMLVRKHQRVLRLGDALRDRQRHESRAFNWYFDDDGMLVFHGKLMPEEGAAFMKAMEAMMKVMESNARKEYRRDHAHEPEASREGVDTFPRKREEAGGRQQTSPATFTDDSLEGQDEFHGESIDESAKTFVDGSPEVQANPGTNVKNVSAETSFPEIPPPTFPQKRADALVMMAEQAFNSLLDGLKPLAGADKYQVFVHLHQVPGPHPHAQEHCTLEHEATHAPLSLATARRLACDASLVHVLEDGKGNTLDIGRKTRAVSSSLRRALHLRDQTCRFPGCCESRYVDAHHIVHWCEGGETKVDNLILLCRHHHRILHQEGYAITRDRKGHFVFTQPDGQAMAQALSPQFANDGINELTEMLAIEAEHLAMGLEIDANTAKSRWGGEVMNYSYAVCGMRDMDEKRAGPP